MLDTRYQWVLSGGLDDGSGLEIGYGLKMDARADAERVRGAFSTANGCTEDTVATLRRLLGSECADDNKENRPGSAPRSKQGSVHRSKAVTPGLKERQPVKAQQKRSRISRLTAKEEQNLATELVNKTLKILTEAVRSHAGQNGTVGGKGGKGGPQVSQSRLALVASSSSIAFSTLRRIRRASAENSGLQLEQGMLALIGKLVSLGMAVAARKELATLKEVLEGSADPNALGKNCAQASLEAMLILSPAESSLSRLKIASQLQAVILRMLSWDSAGVNGAALILSLQASGGPINNLNRMEAEGVDIAQISQSMETLARSIKLIARNIMKAYPEHSLRLEIIALDIRRDWWAREKHQIDVSREVLEPLRSSLRALKTYSTLDIAEQYEVAKVTVSDIKSWDIFQHLQCEDRRQYHKLLATLSELAEASGNPDDTRSWLPQGPTTSPCSGISSQLQSLLIDIKAASLAEETLDALKGYLDACRDLPHADLELLDLISAIRRTLCGQLVKKTPAASRSQEMICICIFDCLYLLQRSSDLQAVSISLMECGILASSTWMKRLSQGSTTSDQFFEAQSCLHDLRQALDGQIPTNLLLAFSSLQWRIHAFCKTIATIKPGYGSLTYLAAAVSALYGLSADDRLRADYAAMLNELAICQMAAHLYREAQLTLRKWIFDFFDVNGAMTLNSALSSLPFTQVFQQAKLGSLFLDSVRLLRRLSLDSRRPCLESVAQDLTDDAKHVLYLAWLTLLHEQSFNCHQQDAQVATLSLLASCDRDTHPLQWSRVCQKIFLLSICRPVYVSGTVFETASHDLVPGRSLGGDAGLKNYREHIMHTGAFLEFFSRSISDPVRVTRPLTFWEDMLDSNTVMDHVDDINFLILLLLKGCTLFEMSGLLFEAHVALDIVARLCAYTSTANSKLVLCVYIAQCRAAIKLGDLITAEEYASKVKRLESDLDFEAQLDLAHLRIRLASKAGNAARLREEIHTALQRFNTHGLRRREKMKLFLFQANVGATMAVHLRQAGHVSLGTQIARASLLLLKSILAAQKKTEQGSPASPASDQIATVIESLAVLDLSGRNGETVTNTSFASRGDPTLVHDVLECLLLLSGLASMHGNHGEAKYFVDQADEAIRNMGLTDLSRRQMTQSLQLQVLSGHQEELAMVQTKERTNAATGVHPDMTGALLEVAKGDWHVRFRSLTEALDSYTIAVDLVQQDRSAAKAGKTLSSGLKSSNSPTIATQTNKRPAKTTKPARPASSTSARRPAAKVAGGRATENSPAASMTQERLSMLGCINRQRALALLKDKDVAGAVKLLGDMSPTAGTRCDPRVSILQARLALAQVTVKAVTDVNFSSLPESTLAIPSTYSPSRSSGKAPSTKVSAKTVAKEPSKRELCHSAGMHDLLVDASRQLDQTGHCPYMQPLSQVYEAADVTISAKLLLSAVGNGQDTQLSPEQTAHMLELPADEAFRRQICDVSFEKRKAGLNELLEEAIGQASKAQTGPATTLYRDFVEVLPDDWTVVSLSMNEDGTELWAARYNKGDMPLVLRIPMSRSREGDLDDDAVFTYGDAKQELVDIIKASDYSCHNPPDAGVKGGKSRWWEERQSLDARMRDLMTNMEDIWFGGFKGVLSLQGTKADLLARFRKTFDGILDRHLPSRGAKVKSGERAVLHPQILSLFTQLDLDREDNIDEHVMDLLFFIVDLLHWNGEVNALDEIDLDQMAVETLDAMRAYHDAVGVDRENRHLILRLDKRLHGFPWESMPCLQGHNVSRVASLCQIRERILASKGAAQFAVDASKGTYILNPSGDLTRTQETLGPALRPLLDVSWTPVVQTKPDEEAFSNALGSSNCVLYFGHGSGTQYIRERAIQRLNRCAPVVWLMGCSSGTASEHGQLETTSVPLSYLAAGKADLADFLGKGREGLCMAVVATLWDVTDKDIDKFSLAVGEKWGLFAPSVGAEEAAPPKTPRKKAKEMPKTPGKTPGARKMKAVEINGQEDGASGISLPQAVAKSRDVCYLRYLNGAASVVYGVPVYLDKSSV